MAALVCWPFCKARPSRLREAFSGSSVTDMAGTGSGKLKTNGRSILQHFQVRWESVQDLERQS
jgi:hypothetical protein